MGKTEKYAVALVEQPIVTRMPSFCRTETRLAVSAAVLAAVLLGSPATHAQTPAAGDDELRAQSKALWKRASQKYTLAKWDEAIGLFEEAYEVWPYAKILFNLCQAHRQKKSYERAIFFCRAYLRADGDVDGRAQVSELIDEMEHLAAKQDEISEKPPEGIQTPPDDEHGDPSSSVTAPIPARVVDPTVDGEREREHVSARAPTARRWYHDGWGWGFAGTGGVTAMVGAALLLDARGIDDDADDELDQVERVRLRDRADSRRRAGYVATSVGVGLLVAGVIKLALHTEAGDGAGITGVALGPSWIALGGRF
jgi:tetratricopeptide (TPR) repeat protein